MSKIWRSSGLACLAAAGLLITSSMLRADTGPSVRVTSAIGQGVVRLDAKADGPFQFTVHHPSTDLYFIDLTGVTPSTSDAAQVLGTDIVRSYRLEQFKSGTKTVSRLEILLGAGAKPKILRQGQNEVVIIVSKSDVETAGSGIPATPHVVNASLRTPSVEEKAGGPASIRQISVAKRNDSPEVLVLGSGAFDYKELQLDNPARLVLDFAGMKMVAPRRIHSTIDPILDVRAAQFSPQVARVVIDLSTSAPYSVSHVEGGIAVHFRPAVNSAAAPADKGSSEAPLADSQTASATEATTQATQTVTPDPPPVSQNSATPAVNSQDAAAVPPAQDTQAPASPSPMPAATDPAPTQSQTQSPAQTQAQPPAQAPQPSPVVTPEQPLQAAPSTEPAPTPITPEPAAPAPAMTSATASPAIVMSQEPQAPGMAKYTGAPISVDLKNVDLQDFFRLIHLISGLNVVVDPNVRGTLTLVLDNVPWDQALEVVLKNNDLDKQLEGNVLRIATKATIKKEADEERELAKSQVEAADLVTTTRVLSYATAGDLVATIKKFLSPRGDVLADSRTNTLIISDIPTVIPVVDNLIRELDTRSQQVEIEARVVAANRNFSREIGTQLAFAGSMTGGRSVFGGDSTVGTSPITRFVPPLPAPPLIVGTSPPSTTSSTGVQMPLATNLSTIVPTSGVSYAFSSTNFALDYIINAAEAKGVGKLLSKPTLITQNNEQAKIEQGTKIPIQTVINNTISVQFVDAVLELQVTPQITKEGTIFMNIHVENTAIDPAIPRVNGIPALDTESADSKVLVNDGATVKVGGIIISQQRTDIQEVPYVGSLPIIGRLFQHRTVSTQSQELLFFITPRILPN